MFPQACLFNGDFAHSSENISTKVPETAFCSSGIETELK